jgi:acetaldehyde dehydrogenase (acetylating)
MTLGCGGWGGNITSDNISPRHLLNVKRLAWELRPAVPAIAGSKGPGTSLPRVSAPPAPGGLDARAMASQVESLYRSGAGPSSSSPTSSTGGADGSLAVVDFVCEEDVRQAMRLSRKIMVGERTIVTPAARDLADAHRIFVTAGWPRS